MIDRRTNWTGRLVLFIRAISPSKSIVPEVMEKQLSQHELKQRQKQINDDNDNTEINEYYDSLEDDPWLNDYSIENEILSREQHK